MNTEDRDDMHHFPSRRMHGCMVRNWVIDSHYCVDLHIPLQ